MTIRQQKIVETLAVTHRIEVTTLANILGVSQVTVRKDLDHLEEQGFIQREHGYAVFGSIDDVRRRMALHYDIKHRIAQAAASMVEEGETVMIESGSCCAMLAEELANTKQNVVIITNSAFIANHIRQAPFSRIILLGGEYQANAQVVVGSMTRKCAEVFLCDKFFVGADGFSEKYGFTGNDHLRASTVRAMAEQADEIIVLTESEKFSHHGMEGLIRPEKVAKLYTDDRIPADKEQFLIDKKVRIYKVPAVVEAPNETLKQQIPLDNFKAS
jgi:DeoR/GlpR family transcriptional regulator of sugar metabolism